jgi:hypothetical protein
VLLSNSGKAHAFDVSFSFSNEFETKWIKPTQVEAGKTETVEVGIMSKKDGTIPLEITLDYRDGKGTPFKETHEFWIDVMEMGMTTTSGSHTPSTGQFTPGTTTLRQLPADLSDQYTEAEFIGKCGFARVFKAKRKDGKFVALKIPSPWIHRLGNPLLWRCRTGQNSHI